uniref:hypothetical protein n=1 Tax=Candidatus Electronema sp. TaxID=2698783 RepID=UPI0040579987
MPALQAAGLKDRRRIGTTDAALQTANALKQVYAAALKFGRPVCQTDKLSERLLPRRIFEMPRIIFTMSCGNFKRIICNTAALPVRQMPHPKPGTIGSKFTARRRRYWRPA